MELIDEEAEQAAQAAEQDTEPQPEEQQLPPEPPKPLAVAKEELAVALNKFKNRSGDLEFNEKRLAEAEKEEEDLLEASNLSEEEQIEKLSKTVARKRVLERKIEHGCNEIEGAEVELEHATKEAFRSFDRELSDLRSAREQKHMTALKKLVEPEQWHWAQVHAGSFVQYVSDLMAIKWLGYQAQIYSTMAPSRPAQSSS